MICTNLFNSLQVILAILVSVIKQTNLIRSKKLNYMLLQEEPLDLSGWIKCIYTHYGQFSKYSHKLAEILKLN